MKRRLFIYLTLGVFCLAFRDAPAAEQTDGGSLGGRVARLFEILSSKDGRHLDTRERISGFFRNLEECDRFIVGLSQQMGEEGIKNGQINEWEVLRVEQGGVIGETEVWIEGDWWLFLDASLERRDEWRLQDETWYLIPPPIKDLPYE